LDQAAHLQRWRNRELLSLGPAALHHYDEESSGKIKKKKRLIGLRRQRKDETNLTEVAREDEAKVKKGDILLCPSTHIGIREGKDK